MDNISSIRSDTNFQFTTDASFCDLLPPELLNAIFSYCNPKDSQSISFVCRHWNLIVLGPITNEIEKLQNLLNSLGQRDEMEVTRESDNQSLTIPLIGLFQLKLLRNSLKKKAEEVLQVVHALGICHLKLNAQADLNIIIEVLPFFQNNDACQSSLRAIFFILARSGHFTKALEITTKLQDYCKKNAMIKEIAEGMYALAFCSILKGDLDTTLQIINALPILNFEYLCRLCLDLSTNHIDLAKKLLTLFPDCKNEIICNVCEMLQKEYRLIDGWIDKASQLCGLANDDAKIGYGLAELCKSLAKDYPEDARKILELIPEGFYKKLAFARIAKESANFF